MCRVRDTRLSHRRLYRKKSPEKGMPKKNARAPAEWQDARAVPPRTRLNVVGIPLGASTNSKFFVPAGNRVRSLQPLLSIRLRLSRGLHQADPGV